jgi:hypothetical protein
VVCVAVAAGSKAKDILSSLQKDEDAGVGRQAEKSLSRESLEVQGN